MSVQPNESAGYLAEGATLRPSIRDRIKAQKPYESTLVEVPQWDAVIELRSLTLGERNNMLQQATAGGDGDMDITIIYPALIIATCYDPETGEKVFSDDDQAFVQAIPASLADKLAMPALELSGMKEAAIDAEAKKSSETEPSGSAS